MSKIIHDDTVLRVRPGVDILNLELSPQEGYILSRISQPITVREIYLLSLLDKSATATIIKKLADEGILEIQDQEKGSSENEKSSGKITPLPKVEEEVSESVLKPYKFGGFIFDLTQLQEDVELDENFKKEILYLFENLEHMNHYEILGLKSSADPAAVKTQFLKLSKRYHPDNYFRKELGSFGEKIKRIYNRFSEAHNLLMDSVEHREYRRELIEKGEIEQSEEDIMEDPVKREQRRKKEFRQRRASRNPLMERVKKAREFYEAALHDISKESWLSAASNLKLAISFDAHNELYKLKLEQVRDNAEKATAERFYQRGLVLESYGQDGYLEAFLKAVQIYPSGAEYNIKVARHYADQMDWDDAQPFAKRAVQSDPKNVEYRLLFGQILLRLRKKDEAAKQFEAALEVDPKNELAKSQLKEAKKWF